MYEIFQLNIAPMIISRAILLECLLKETTNGSCTIHTDKRLVSYSSNDSNTVTLSFADGETATADLLIGADGVYSQVRETMFRDAPELAQPVFSGQLAYRLKCRAEDLPADHRAHSRFLIVCRLFSCIWSVADPDSGVVMEDSSPRVWSGST